MLTDVKARGGRAPLAYRAPPYALSLALVMSCELLYEADAAALGIRDQGFPKGSYAKALL